MDAPANTWNYFYAGYTVIFLVMGIYLASLLIRWRNLKLDIEALHDIKTD
jgi:hypothetical protein